MDQQGRSSDQSQELSTPPVENKSAEAAHKVDAPAPQLSPSMQSCLHYVNEFGGVLRRYQGGFWARPNWRGLSDAPWFGTPTVEALVTRGVMVYTGWKEHGKGGGQFPVEAKVVAPARETGTTTKG